MRNRNWKSVLRETCDMQLDGLMDQLRRIETGMLHRRALTSVNASKQGCRIR